MLLTSILAAAALFQVPQAVVTDVKVGEGTEAKLGDVVTINYVGKFLDGQMFDSTKMTPPYSFVLGTRELLQGYSRIPFGAFDKSLVGMKVGGTRQVVLPPELAFGDLQVGDIPPGTRLTFEVELFDVRPKGSEAKMKFEDLKEGTGDAARDGDTVEAHYRGLFLNGRQFDSSYGKMTETGPADVPITVTLGARGIIEGFQKGLTGMKVGGKRRVTIPYELAYGKNGRQGIPPYSVLVFELDMMKITKKP